MYFHMTMSTTFPKLETFCPSLLRLVHGCSNDLATQHGVKLKSGDSSFPTQVHDLPNQSWPFKSVLLDVPAGETLMVN